MKPEQKLKWKVIECACRMMNEEYPIITKDNVDEIYDQTDEDYIQDAKCEIRSGSVSTNLPSPYSRHYECNEVADIMPDGSWVGWTYWYGGGKHGEPSAIDWMSDAYNLDCVEEEKLVTVRTFTKI